MSQLRSLGGAPPTNFKRKHRSEVLWAKADLAAAGYWNKTRGNSSRVNGLRYERRVVKYFSKFYDVYTQVPVYFGYESEKSWKIIPDLLIMDKLKLEIVVAEIKREHTSDAYHQLQYYRPVLEKAFPAVKISTLEVCGSYPPRSAGEKLRILEDLSELWNLSLESHNVLVLSAYTLRLGLGSLRDGYRGVTGTTKAALR